ncbi:CPBP family intramembrane glutamic endopeptidase [Schaalia sp. Marseille-Q2122]|uniref:CPBP family intramembrane glutamic endopeptidase n=1 Tax=Schaalia sp. Marseille-Q2122 TaxID=2736604 RepID=UPI001589A467|nr:CPBP family intramembrane glutamic endopeptidase [Schaalia sp. Marseille-Q2122]
MGLFISELIGALVQLLLLSVVPLIWWLVTARTRAGFFSWIGLRAPERFGGALVGWSVLILVATFVLGVGIQWLLAGTPVAASKFAGLGVGALPAILVFAFVGTALGEEIFFRGFLLKRFNSAMSFQAANTAQGALFGVLHGIMFFSLLPFVSTLLVIVFTGVIGWSLGMVNERLAGGSIVPSWLIHAGANLLAGLSMAFGLFALAPGA